VVGPELKGQIYGRDSDTWRIERAGQGDRVVEDGVAPRFVGSCGCGAEPQTPTGHRGLWRECSFGGVRYTGGWRFVSAAIISCACAWYKYNSWLVLVCLPSTS